MTNHMNNTLIESLVFRKAEPQDYAQIVMMHKENLNTVLTDQEKASGGFLSVPLRAEDFQAMNQEIAVVVASCGKEVVAYHCASSCQYYQSVPLCACMMDRFPHVLYDGKPLVQYTCFVVGPMCIAKNYRGKGIYLQLWQELAKHIPAGLEMGVGPASEANPRALHAHTQKAGMLVVDRFMFNDQRYVTLALRADLLPRAAA
jgi:hypothetical protein